MTIQVTDFTICTASFSEASLPLLFLYRILQFILSVALLGFALIQVLKQSFEMYKATKQWQPNKYLQQLITDGIIYFLVYVFLFCTLSITTHKYQELTTWTSFFHCRNVFYNGVALIQLGSITISGTAVLFLSILSYITIVSISPRFIISIRELYDRDLRGRWNGIDSGFGVLSQAVASEDAVVSAIAFADVNPGQEEGQVVGGNEGNSEGIRLELLGDGTQQV